VTLFGMVRTAVVKYLDSEQVFLVLTCVKIDECLSVLKERMYKVLFEMRCSR
jgi:hypothetical protein